jgi:hypothetical protein
MISAVKRSTGFDQVRLARSSRAKTECGADAGRTSSGATRPTEDKAARRFAAARTAPGSTDRTRATSRGKTHDFNPVVSNSCSKKHKHRERGPRHHKH